MRRCPVNSMTKLIAMVLTISIFAVACGGGTETNPEKLIPEGSNLIAQVNVAGFLSSGAVATILDALPEDEDDPVTLDGLLDQAIGATGIDFRQVSRLVFFGDVSRSDDFTGFIAKGTFNETAIVEVLERLGGKSSTSVYKGRRVYGPDGDTDGLSLAFLEGDILVLGTMEAVRAVIDVQEGDRRRVSGTVPDALADLGQVLLSLAVEVPSEEIPDQLSDLGDFPFFGDTGQGLSAILGPLQDLEILGFALAQNGQILILRVNLDFANEDSASSVGQVLNGVLTLSSGLIPDAEVRELLESLEVSADDSRLTIRLEVAASELGLLISSITAVSDVETSAPEGTVTVRRLIGLGEAVEIMPTRDHVAQGQTVAYSTTPPTSGDHWDSWADCGFYPDGLPDELIVHNLEHGNIVVSYNLASQSEIDQLRAALESIDLVEEWGVIRSYDKIPEGMVSVAAWGRRARMPGFDLEGLDSFFAGHAGAVGPERIAC